MFVAGPITQAALPGVGVMRMDKATQSFQLDYGPPAPLIKRPRLWRLTIDLLLTASAAAVIGWISGLPS